MRLQPDFGPSLREKTISPILGLAKSYIPSVATLFTMTEQATRLEQVFAPLADRHSLNILKMALKVLRRSIEAALARSNSMSGSSACATWVL